MDIEFESAGVSFGARVALEPLTLGISGKRIGVIGLNGSGKTTFARLINGLTKPTTGRVMVNGRDTADEKAVVADVGFIFQSPQNQIILPIVKDDIAFGLKRRGFSKAEIEARVEGVLARFGAEALADRRAHELSGGELQLAALCSVLATGPGILILDEPTNQLDLKNRALVERIIAGLPESAIVITHDLELIAGFERVLLFHQGRLAADAPAAEAIARYREIAA
ncbi:MULTISPECIES: energy-coupling factor ABC transporter ATP-binding protein [Rhizobium]|uniref:ABC transporter ATP-binding protein n=1 Tax=Rhizobium bangladeshense TaxID=1138189 RepID=A0ABS7LDK8_9HYPH|nr:MULTISPECIES: ABC transporter ATP-binding protein [Rhizobium]MBX4875291.1 ABC transporter ATP-binding protein [Rhizobium bangladeshense]MBX4882039.1 ABC transporter ATP-binding protein [Rhizobium bangladeshense]MBX4892583.1 ABC transporter ATP-binding protein [Rhizobium bangladeshense]MBX4902319.1 ABC transporter ATP-binding protein [Rhizobium bangladeshense]MBX4913849.1 ABC transporter ATP-binding protein [Rhizobium bangladeshense]